MSSQIRYGFLDKINNVFYEVESKQEYERCLDYYNKMVVEEEERRNREALSKLDDFADVLGDFTYNENSSCFPELQ
jgi:hypothetical protein